MSMIKNFSKAASGFSVILVLVLFYTNMSMSTDGPKAKAESKSHKGKKGKGPLSLAIVPSETKYDEPEKPISLRGQILSQKPFEKLHVEWLITGNVEVVSGETHSTIDKVKSGENYFSDLNVKFKSPLGWKVVLTVYELIGDARHGQTYILTPPQGGISTKSVKTGEKPYSLEGLKVIY